MRHPTLTWLLALAACLPAPVRASARPADTSELDQFEEKTLSRSAERAVRAAKSDRVLWVKALEEEFPNKVGNPLKEEEYGDWFDLLAGKGGEWRREAFTDTPFADLFDRVIQRLELGPVPSIKRDEFLKYARKVLVPATPGRDNPAPDPNEDADRVFRALDRDGDGILAAEELTTKLRDDRRRFDADANGRIDKDEYRVYFQRRIGAVVEAAGAKGDDRDGRNRDPKAAARTPAKAGFPEWLTELDTNTDGQIALHEWRRGGRALDAFTAMDLDGDGLLTKDEFQRYAKMKEEKERMADPDDPPGR